jgi:hypothetical protein
LHIESMSDAVFAKVDSATSTLFLACLATTLETCHPRSSSWHLTTCIFSFVFKQLFMLLVPELVVWFEVVAGVRFPSESDFVQNSLWMDLVAFCGFYDSSAE